MFHDFPNIFKQMHGYRMFFFELFSPFQGFGVFFEHIHVFLGPILCFAE